MMWKIKYAIFWTLRVCIIILPVPKERKKNLLEWLTIYFAEKSKQAEYKTRTPEEIRDNYIASQAERIQETLLEQANRLSDDPKFLYFLERSAYVDGAVTVEDIKEFYKKISPQYAKVFYLFNQLVGVQYTGASEYEEDRKVPLYALQYASNKLPGDKKALTLEVVKDELKLKGVNYPFLDFNKFFDMPHIVDVEKAVVNTSYMHYAWELMTQLFENAPNVTSSEDENLQQCAEEESHPVAINIMANRIAREARRGAGNVIIVSDKDLEDLKYSLWNFENRSKSAKDVKSYSEFFTRENHIMNIPEFEQLGFLKYEFSFNSTYRVFSSSMFDEIKRKTDNDDINMIMLYSGHGAGTSTDAALLMGVGEICNWIPWKEIDAEEIYNNYCDTFRGLPEGETMQLYKIRDSFVIDYIRNHASACPQLSMTNRMVKFNLPLLKEEK